MKSAYTYSVTTAMLLTLLILSGCSGGAKRSTVHIQQQREAELQVAAQEQQLLLQTHLNIDEYVELARLENPETTALNQLLQISQDQTLPEQSRGQAALQYAELLFEFDHADAISTTEATLEQWAMHPFAPHTHLLLAKQWALLENSESAISEYTAALEQPNIDPYTLADIIEGAQPLLNDVSEQSSVTWMLTASMVDIENRELWLQQAAKFSTLEYVIQLRQSEQSIRLEQSNYYRYVARERLMVGDYHAVRIIARILELDMPDTEAYAVVKYWAESEGELSTIGVLLPLTGKYAMYGQQALQGIRLALSRPEFEDIIILRIQDTAGDENQTVSGYHQLLTQGAQWIIGPLLSSSTQALMPYLNAETPVISLSNQVQLASDSPALFMHSLAKTVQADFMANYAISQDKEKVLIIHDHFNSAVEEAAAFAQTFMDAGGEIVDVVELQEGISDYRPDLVAMRSRTDDEGLLAQLEDDLFLFSPELEMDIKLPLNMDAIYIAAPGKKISVLAGQMAYSDISDVQFYGSHRWQDDHLMDDKGRYLNAAKFSTPITSLSQPDQAILDVQSQYRVIWAENEEISPLFALAYDSAMNVAALGSRLGLTGAEAINALNTTIEFPAISGNYHFDKNGISQKKFAIQTIRRGRIETIQIGK